VGFVDYSLAGRQLKRLDKMGDLEGDIHDKG